MRRRLTRGEIVKVLQPGAAGVDYISLAMDEVEGMMQLLSVQT
jgi:hypothetical protein